MRFKKIAEWEAHDSEPGGDVGFLVEAIDITHGPPRYLRISWSVLTDDEFHAFERGEEVDLRPPTEFPDRGYLQCRQIFRPNGLSAESK